LEGVVGNILTERGLTLATMESCTGGLLSNTITDVPGSSKYFKGGLVTYTSEMKVAFGVKEELIKAFGVVSPQVAEAMATAVKERLGADIGVGITGVAGPEALEDKPVGTIHIAIDAQGKLFTFSPHYPFDRLRIKRLAVTIALFHLRRILHQL
jgi:nicotinamide-nucleotide amidase